ncbi:hypothetical protein [Streptomyces sp. NPDC003401]
MGSRRRAVHISAMVVGAALALGATAAPATAGPQRSTATVRAQTTAAPAPTGLAYTYDAAGRTVTVTWDPKDPADTVTRAYRPALCGETPQAPCFVSPDVVAGNSFTFTKSPGTAPVYVRIYAENADRRLTGSAVLVVTI